MELASKLGCKSADISDVVKNSKYIFLGVKPQVMQSVIDEIKPIPNYDRVEHARVGGWWVIVKKDQ